jgi:YD repeat-containing protein
MVSIFTGLGAGFGRGSATTLGSSGLLGSGSLGRNNEQVSLNAATGNLLIGQRDEFLVGLGPDSPIGRTYNSLEDVTDGDNNDHWRQGTTRGIHGLTGTLNTTGSTVKRTSGDGSDITYTWNATASAYVATDGDGAHDTLSYAAGVWTWTDGASQFTEKYAAHGVYGLTGTVNTTGSTITRIKADGTSSTYTWDTATSKYIVSAGTASTDNLTYAGGVWTWSNSGTPLTQYYYNNGANWRITELANTIGQKLTFTYAGATLDKVTTQDGSYEQYSWSGGHISQIVTGYTNLATGAANQTLTRTRYGYDAYNRLTTVTVDLSPNDNVIADGKTYVTTYTYKSATAGTPGFTQVATIAQTDGSSISVDYDGAGRVTTFTQAVAGGVTRMTSIVYGAGSTTITDPLMQVTTLEYNADGSLKKVTAPPAYSGAAAQVAQFGYDGSGNVLTTTDALGVASTFTYDASGNMLTSTDRLGNVVTRTYSAKNELLTETRTGSDASGASVSHTTRYAYDTNYLLRYAVSAEGEVTEYRYDALGRETSQLVYTDQKFSLSGYTSTQPVPETSLNAWVVGLADRSTVQRTDTAYNLRGDPISTTSYGVLSAGGTAPGDVSVIQAGAGTTASLQTSGLTRIAKTSGTTAFDADASSTMGASGDFALQIKPNQTNANLMVGVSQNPSSSTSNVSLQYAFYFQGFNVNSADSGNALLLSPSFAVGDTFWLVRTGTTINYYKGATLDAAIAAGSLRTVAGATGTFYFDCTVQSTGASFDVAFMSDPAGIQAGAGTTASLQTSGLTRITKTSGTTAFDADASSTMGASGDFALQIKPNQTNANLMVGVSQNPSSSTSNVSLQYAFYFQGFNVNSADSGNALLLSPSFAVGDTFWLVRTGTTINYYKGATLDAAIAAGSLRTVAGATGTFYFDCTMQSTGASFDVAFAAIDSGTDTSRTAYIYDQAGQVLSRTITGLGTETFVYDGLGRITASTDLNGNTTSFVFNDSTMQTVVTLTNGYVQTSVYNKAGELVSFTDSGSNVTGGTAYYAYDQRGQLRITTDATNHNSYVVYDKTGRKVADVDHYGNLIEYRYDANDLLVTTIRYATAITSTQLTTLQNPLSNVEMSTLRPSAAATDMWAWTVYDAEGRVVEAINGDGGVTTYQYDGESRLIGTVSYYNKLTSTQVTTIKATPPSSAVLPTVDAVRDSVARNFYDKSGRLIGVLDSEGYLSRITYDAGGRKVVETAFATITTAGLRATGSFNALVTSVTTVTNPADRIMRYVYDGQGYLRFQIDSLNQVTEYVYDSGVAGGAIGVVRQTIQYAGTIGALSDYKIATVKMAVAALASNPDNRKSWAVYDTSNRLAYAIDATGAVTGFSYDNLGQVTKSVRFATTRSTATLPDLATMISWQTANTSATTDRVTRNYYTARGELRYAVDAEGYVTRFDYDAEGRTIGTARWDTAITASDSTTIANVATLATGTYATTATSYDMDGRVATRTDGEGVVTGYVYNANGTLLWTTVATGTSDEAKTVYEYDNAGRVVTRYDAYGTAEVAITRFTYDGFGNVLTVTDPAAAVTTRTYDRLGQVLSEINPLSGAVAYQYNAFGEAVKATDERGNVSFSYYDTLGRVTLSYDAGQYGTQSSYTVFGELASVKRWYNKANNAGSVTVTTQPTFTADAARDATTSFLYDKVGRLLGSTDALGAVVSYTLNAFGDIVTEVDPLESSPATTIQTTRTYDRRGLLKTQVVDSAGGGKALTTTYGYDAFGRVVSLTNPASQVTTSSYDRNGRLKTLVDALSHTTTYSYDKRGNLAAVQDVMSQITRYTYDGNDRLIYTVDALGGVTQNSYDADGRVILSKAYASAISLAGLVTITTTAAITAALAARVSPSSNDQLTRSVYDTNGQLRFSVDAANFLTEFVYDAAGNAIRSIAYSTAIASAPTYTMATIATQIAGMSAPAIVASPIIRNVYNADNQRGFTIDALGNVTAYTYDAQGNVVKQQRVAANYVTAGDPTDAAMATWLASNGNATNDRISRAIYDQNGQLRFDVDAEGYVTQYTYNAAGSVRTTVRYADRFNGTGGFTAFTDATTLAQAIANVAATPTAPAAITEFKYDSAGRLTETVDPEGTRTVMTLNQLGQALSTAVAYGTADESVTTNSYDALGRVLTETRGYGQPEATTRTFIYDSIGNMLTEQDGRLNTVTRTYDALGHVLTVTVPLDASTNAVTTNSYDAFGNLVKIVDPRGNSGYFYYDAHNQLVLQVDPEGYATATSYTFTGQTASVTRYAVKPTGTPAIGAPPTIVSTPASDAVSTFTYDKLDRVLTTAQVIDTTPSHNITESYGYNAFGDRTSVTNKLGGLTTNSFDKRGLLLTEVIQVAVGSTITNTYAYDARGNLTQMVEASSTAKPRTTGYAYDKLDRLTTTTHDQVTVSTSDLSSTSLVTPVDVLTYDRRGNVIKSVTAQVGGSGGAATWAYYDDADRKIAEIDALGTMSKWTYDANGNTLTATVYGDAVTPTGPGGTPPAPVSPTNARTTTYAYDKNNRLTTTTGPAIKMGGYNGTSYVITTDAAVATNEYDAAGNIITQTDGRGNKTWSFYNKLGQQLAQVDQENYLTTWVRDANGNVTSETRYANKITGAFTTTSTVAALQTLAGTNATSDRTTTFTYDLAARRLTETRIGVVTLANTSGTPTTSLQDSQIVYTYNGLGEVLTKREANGDTTTYGYDAIGRTLTQTDPGYNNQSAQAVARLTTYTYDGLNNVLSVTVSDALGHSGGEQHGTTYVYNIGGRLASVTDALGKTRSYAYDAAGRTLGESYTRTPGSGAAFNETINYRYDTAGRLTYQTVAHKAVGASTWIFDADTNQIQYNAYGDVTARGMNGQWQETYDYDAAGHVWRSNSGDGSARIYLYDKGGDATLTIASSGGVNLATYTLDAALNLVTNTGASAAGSIAVTGAVVTIDVFDKRNQDIDTREAFREVNPNISNPAIYDTALIRHQRSYNAFGEVASETDARGNVTNYTYNTMGRVIKKENPTVSVTAENGGISSVRPTEDNYYDISGRLVAVKDANDHTSRRVLLAGTGYGGGAALVVTDTHADGWSALTAYDVFGNARTLTDEFGNAETQTYDLNRNLLTVAHRGGLLTDYYGYDELGQRTRHWNSQFNTNPASPTILDLTNYDGQGRVISQVISSGSPDAATTTYGYAWVANGGAGYWTKTTVNTAGLTATENDDYFGHVLARTDFGGHVFSYVYDYAGRLTAQTNNAGANIAYSYYNSGRLAKIVTGTDNGYSSETATSLYSYDVDGNRTRENHAVTGYWYDYYDGIAYAYTTSHQDATAVWDAMNRMVSFTDSGASGSAPASIVYEYDAVGNVRHMGASYRALDAQGNVAGTATTQDYWYRYDSMDRFVTTMGTFTGTRGTTGAITRGATGIDITYDQAGRRATATGTTTLNWSGWKAHNKGDTSYYWYEDEQGDWGDPISVIWLQASTTFQGTYQDTYTYRADGQLMGVTTATQVGHGSGSSVVGGEMGGAGTTGTYVRDAMGRTTSYTAPNYSATSTYDYLNALTSQTTDTARSDGSYHAVTTYDYRAETYAGSGVWTGAYQGGSVVQSVTTTTKGGVSQPTTDTKTTLVWWDSAQASHVTFTPNIASPGTTNNSSYYYDDAGHLQSVYIQDGRSRTVSFVNNAEGQILSRDESDSLGTGDPRQLHYYFNGQRIGDISNNGSSSVDYVAANAQRTGVPGTGPFAGGSATSVPYADFDQSYDPINGLDYAQAASRYTVNTGDTLASIATQLWGDASLWYKLAQANGLTGSETLVAGMSLIVPAGVRSSSNSDSTFRPYDPSVAQGDLSPTAPKPAAKNKNCGVFGMILLAVIAVAVAYFVGPEAIHFFQGVLGGLTGTGAVIAGSAGAIGGAIVGGAVTGAIASVVSQGVGVATRIQDKFSWKGVALAALSGAVGGGVGQIKGLDGILAGTEKTAVTGLRSVTSAIGRAVIGNVATQGIAIATRLQKGFDWTGVATAAISGGVIDVVGRAVGVQAGVRSVGNALRSGVAGAAGAIASAGTRSIVEGTSFGDNVMAALPDVIGQTIGNIVAGGIASIGKHGKPINLLPEGLYDTSPDVVVAPGPAAAGAGDGSDAEGAYAGLAALTGRFPGGGTLSNASFLQDVPESLPSDDPFGMTSAPADEVEPDVVVTGQRMTEEQKREYDAKHGFFWHLGNIFSGRTWDGTTNKAYEARAEAEMANHRLAVAIGQGTMRWMNTPVTKPIPRTYFPADPALSRGMMVAQGMGFGPPDLPPTYKSPITRGEVIGHVGTAASIVSPLASLARLERGAAAGVRTGTLAAEEASLRLPVAGDAKFIGPIKPDFIKGASEGWGEYLTRMKGPAPDGMFDPHAHHIVLQAGNGAAQKALVAEGQGILRSVGIDPITGPENLVWAPMRVADQHAIGPLRTVVTELREAQQFGLSRDAMVEILTRNGKLAAARR